MKYYFLNSTTNWQLQFKFCFQKKFFIIFSFNNGGSENLVVDLLNSWKNKKDNLFLCVVNDFYDEKNLDVIIVPAIVFDLRKNRIGFGGGYYDTFLKKVRGNNKKTLFVGVCYDFQITDKIPTEEHDVVLDFVVSENRII